MEWIGDAARWYGVALVATWGLAPWSRLLGWSLADFGATIARPIALLLLVWPLWFLSSVHVLTYTTRALWISLFLVAGVGWALVLRARLITRAWLRALAVTEIVSAAAFAGFAWYRGFSPQVLNTEKPMDLTLLASSARSTVMPPFDPWMAGERINYYYLGYLVHGAVARMAGVSAPVAFNLALALIFSMSLVAAAGVGFNAVRRWGSLRRALAGGVLAAFALIVAGNLHAALTFLHHPIATVDATWWVGIGWGSSRIVCDAAHIAGQCPSSAETINEFPAFSFVLGDLHPHLMALPFTIAALGLALNLCFGIRLDGGGQLRLPQIAQLAGVGAVVGALYALNSWDYPTYLLVTLAAAVIGLGGAPWRTRFIAGSIVVIASIAAWSPFWRTYVAPLGGDQTGLPAALQHLPIITKLLSSIGVVRGQRTSIGEFLTVFGVPYAFALLLLGIGLVRRRAELSARTRPLVITTVALAIVAMLLPAPLILLCGAPLALAGALLSKERALSLRLIALSLFSMGFVIILVTEFVFLEDVFHNRMNTLFKAYYQVWTVFGLASALTAVILWEELGVRRYFRGALVAGIGMVVAAGLAYPVIAGYQFTSVNGPRHWQGLSGIAYVGEWSPGDLAALTWLSDHAQSDDVVLEAAGCAYQPWGQVPTSFVSAFTGVPTVMGWVNHEGQWRAGQSALLAQLAARHDAIAALYVDPNGSALSKAGVTLLYIGRYEHAGAGAACPDAGPYPAVTKPSYPGPGWELEFSSGGATIYRKNSP